MSDAKYKLTVGLEVHAELRTKTKMFCDSKNDPDETRPNVNICPVCVGHPGTLPVINKEAVKHVLKVGLAVGGKIADFTEFDRKNYFYPDIPKGYQISQYKYPLVSGGELHGVRLTRIHLEEDTGSSVHGSGSFLPFLKGVPEGGGILKSSGSEALATSFKKGGIKETEIGERGEKWEYSFVDFNRAGLPLMELVTEPVIHSAKEAGDFGKEFQLLLRYLNVSEADMEKGQMRVEANISITRINADNNADQRGLETDRGGGLLYEDLSYKIRGAIFNVRNSLGSGHKESIYQNALEEEFKKSGINYEKEKTINIIYEDKKVGVYRPDFVIDKKIILELKALPFIGKKEREQLWHYLRGSEYRLALIVNFGSPELQIERIILDSIRVDPRLDPRGSASSPISVDPRLDPRGSASLGTKVEVKNLNSFRAMERAIAYEYERQVAQLEAGERVIQETRGWDEAKQKTFSQRAKEDSHDYRYFPDPDLPKLRISEIPEFEEKILKKEMPELPDEKRKRYTEEYGIKSEDIEIFIADFSLQNLFEKSVVPKLGGDKKLIQLASNYITNDLVKLAGGKGEVLERIKDNFADLVKMAGAGEISSRGAKDILAEMALEGGDPRKIAEAKNLFQKSDPEALKKVVAEIISANPKVVADYKGGKEASLQYLVGQGMKATKGSANPEVLKKMLIEEIRRSH